jgi:bla regulator protein blaR1
MNLDVLMGSSVVTALGWAILHSLWQIGILAGLLLLILRLIPSPAAQVRYCVSVGFLCVAVALPTATFVQISIADDPAASTISATEAALAVNESAAGPIAGSRDFR